MNDYALLYRDFYLSLEDKEISHDQIVGWRSLNADALITLELLASQDLVDESYHIYVSGTEAATLTIDQIEPKYFDSSYRFKIELYLDNLSEKSEYIVCHEWNDLLRNEIYLKKPIKSIFFISNEKYINEQSNDEKFNNYLNVHKIISFIDYLSESTNSWANTIFYQRPIKFILCLDESDLECNVEVAALENLLKKDLHQEAITNLICKEVVNFIKDIDEKQRLSHLIKHLSSLISNILLSYQSYVENYSFDKVRKEYLEERTEYLKKMNETFDSVATKMLAIPAGIWFATAQITNSNTTNFVASKNIIVLATIFFMVVILIMNIWGHRNTLISLKQEYEEIFSNLSTKFEEESIKIMGVRSELDKRERSLKFKMYFSIFCSLCLLFFTLILFIQAKGMDINTIFINLIDSITK